MHLQLFIALHIFVNSISLKNETTEVEVNPTELFSTDKITVVYGSYVNLKLIISAVSLMRIRPYHSNSFH